MAEAFGVQGRRLTWGWGNSYGGSKGEKTWRLCENPLWGFQAVSGEGETMLQVC